MEYLFFFQSIFEWFKHDFLAQQYVTYLLNWLVYGKILTRLFTLYLQQKLNKQQVWGGSTTVRKQISGTASVAFTPMQGLEIVNPGAAEQKIREANEKYFSNTAGFMSVMKGPWALYLQVCSSNL